MYLLELNVTNTAQNFGLLIEAIFQNSSASYLKKNRIKIYVTKIIICNGWSLVKFLFVYFVDTERK